MFRASLTMAVLAIAMSASALRAADPVATTLPASATTLIAFPSDDAAPGIGAVDPPAAPDPSLPGLYAGISKNPHPAAPGALVAKLADDAEALQVMSFTRTGNTFSILVALAPFRPIRAHYLFAELPRDLPPGRYFVQLTGAEYEYRNGHLSPAPKTTVRAFSRVECSFLVQPTPQQLAADAAQDQAIRACVEKLAARLHALEKEVPTGSALDPSATTFETAANGDLLHAAIAARYNWDGGVPQVPPPPGTIGYAMGASFTRFDINSPVEHLRSAAGGISWDGKSGFRQYAWDADPLGWKVRIHVASNSPDLLKNANAAIDQELTSLASRSAVAASSGGTGSGSPAAKSP